MFQTRYCAKNFITINKACKKCFSTNVKSFKEIPTLKEYPLIGHSYLFFPGGKYTSDKLTEAIEDLSKTLGPIFRLKLGGINMVVSLDPNHAKVLYRNEGKFPIRPSFPALIYYRKKAFNSVGIVPGNGEEWYKYRSGFNPLLKLDLVKSYESRMMRVSQSFVEYIERNRNLENVLEDIFQHLMLFSIEDISTISPGERIDCLSNNVLVKENSVEIIQASQDFMDGLYATLISAPTWKIFKHSGYNKLESAHNVIFKIIKTSFEKHKKSFQTNPSLFMQEQPFLYNLFSNNKLSWDDILMVGMEVFLGGIDATATTLSFVIYFLAQNREVQIKARTNPNDGYLKACIKESLRLRPTAGANGRFLISDIELSGYKVPKGTLVSVFNSAICMNSKYFENPEKFNPNRWLRSSDQNYHPFASLPFGHGPRMCPGRRIAESGMLILIKEILKNFELLPSDSMNKTIGMVYRMNRIPESPINIKFLNTNR